MRCSPTKVSAVAGDVPLKLLRILPSAVAKRERRGAPVATRMRGPRDATIFAPPQPLDAQAKGRNQKLPPVGMYGACIVGGAA